MSKKYKVLGIIGPSGSGKDSAATYLQSLYPDIINKVVLDTTRPPRENEKDEIDYYFTTPAEFYHDLMMGNIVSASEFNGWYYGINKLSLKEDMINLIVFDPTLIKNFETGDLEDFFIIHIKTKDKKRLIKTLKREKKPDCKEICRRFLSDKQLFEEMENSIYKDIDCVTIKNNYNKSFYKDLKRIIDNYMKHYNS